MAAVIGGGGGGGNVGGTINNNKHTFVGDTGSDTFTVDPTSTATWKLTAGDGASSTYNLTAGSGGSTIKAGSGASAIFNLTGGTGTDKIIGGNGDAAQNFLVGGGGDDVLKGGTGAHALNILSGGDGNDKLVAGSGINQMNGGTGADVFKFGLAAVGAFNTITDFSHAEGDKINLAGLAGGLPNGTSLHFVANAAKADAAGAVYQHVTYNAAIGATILEVDVSLGGGHKLEIWITGQSAPAPLAHGDFVL